MIDRRRRSLLRAGFGVAGVIAGGLGTTPRGRGSAEAHRSHVSLTRLLGNASSNSWEFIHAIHFHDAARALARWEPARGWQPTDVTGRARLMLEIERTFVWRDPSGVRIEPRAVGAELEGDSVLVYQEWPAPRLEGTYTVGCTFLHTLFAEQRNVIQIELGGTIQRLELSAADASGPWKFGG